MNQIVYLKWPQEGNLSGVNLVQVRRDKNVAPLFGSRESKYIDFTIVENVTLITYTIYLSFNTII